MKTDSALLAQPTQRIKTHLPLLSEQLSMKLPLGCELGPNIAASNLQPSLQTRGDLTMTKKHNLWVFVAVAAVVVGAIIVIHAYGGS